VFEVLVFGVEAYTFTKRGIKYKEGRGVELK
jgi:hypothetical protein